MEAGVEESEFISISHKGFAEIAKNNKGKYLFWTDNIDVELPIRMSAKGPASKPPLTVSSKFLQHVHKFPEVIALQVQREEEWISYTFTQYYAHASYFAKALIKLNIKQRATVNIIGFNSPEWVIAYIGTIFANCIACGVYSTNSPEACLYVAQNSDAQIIVIQNLEIYQKYEPYLKQLNLVKAIVLYNETNLPEEMVVPVYLWEDFINLGRKFKESIHDTLQERINKQNPGNCCSLFYTSGTTTLAKGVMLSHDNLLYGIEEIFYEFSGSRESQIHERIISYLPLSHVAAFVCDVITNFTIGATVTFAKPDALKGSLLKTMKIIRPTIFFAVPRVWEKIEQQIKTISAKKATLLKIIGSWAKRIGYEGTMNELSNKGTSFEYTAAYHLFLKRVKKSLGLEKAKFIIFGAAPLQKSTLKFFMSLNIKLMNMYGMTETTGPLSVNFPNKAKIETAGKVIPGTQIMIDSKKKEGEIWFRGRTGFMGYYKDPKASEDTYDSDGFIHTGDTGSIDSDGFITVTGRLKDIIITAGGENVSPLLIEATFKSICKIISNVIVIGEGRKFLSLVVTLPVLEDLNSNLPQSFPSDILQLLQAIQSKAKNIKEAQKCVKIGQYMQKCVEKLNKRAISRAQEIKKWRILGNDFTIEGGELTPTLKLKRNLINKKYKHIINKMYAESNL